MLYASWEDVQVDVRGPRTGKTSSRAILTVLEAPGAAFATSSKRDLHDTTRLIRERSGRVWNLDPEELADGQPEFFWNPLSFVTSDQRAKLLTGALAGATRLVGARTDSFFDGSGEALVANLLRAAALDRRTVTAVYSWVTNPADGAPVRILRSHGLTFAAEASTRRPTRRRRSLRSCPAVSAPRTAR